MGIEKKTVVIDGNEYEITQLGAKQGRKIWLALLKAAAVPMKELGAMNELGEAGIVKAIALGIENLDDQVAEMLYETFGASSTLLVGDRRPYLTGAIFDQHFAGQYVTLSKWLWEHITFNFLGFLGDLSIGSLGARVQELSAAAASKREKTSNSPTTSTGSSGES